uniref:Uncharacterized protein n=1 Tax=Rhizophora mucronata TaxID=61149 RepID=A0A2P2JK20_RHIMU
MAVALSLWVPWFVLFLRIACWLLAD